MHLLTWLWEAIPVTTNNTDTTSHLSAMPRQRRRLSILLAALLALACLITPIIWQTLQAHSSFDAIFLAVFVWCIEVIYLSLAHYLVLEPDMDNLGWFGGLMNDPFQFADNQNRIILFVKSILLPGRLINLCFKDLICLISKPD